MSKMKDLPQKPQSNIGSVRHSLPLTNQKLWEMSKVIVDKQKKVKDLKSDVDWESLTEDWFNWLVAFLKIIPFTLWDRKSITDEGIVAKEKEFKEDIDMDTFLFLDEVVSKMLYGIKELRQNCPSCGEEVHTDMTFPKGASSIFKPGISLLGRIKK